MDAFEFTAAVKKLYKDTYIDDETEEVIVYQDRTDFDFVMGIERLLSDLED